MSPPGQPRSAGPVNYGAAFKRHEGGTVGVTTIVLERTQRLQALDRANRVRTVRAQLKREIASGEVTAAEVILAQRWELDGMSLSELLVCQRRWGDLRSLRFLAVLGMSSTKTIGSMTERQRIAAAAELMAE
jgi:hypothetical protein